MNEDELRAFLESATVDDKTSDDRADAEHATAEADAPAAPHPGAEDPAKPRMSFEELMGLGSGDTAQDAATAQAKAAGRQTDAAPEPPTAPPAPSGSQIPEPKPAVPRQAPEPELTPIVLPGPPTAPKSNGPFWEPRRAVDPEAAAPAVPSAAPTAPAAQSPAEPPPTAPLPLNEMPSGGAPQETQTRPIAATGDPLSGLFAAESNAPATPGDDYEKIAVVGSEKTRSRFMPWLIVGAGAVLAIVASLIIVFAVRGGEEPPPVTEPTTQSPAEPTEEPIEEPTEEPTPEPTEPAADEAPEVEVGRTGSFNIDSWGMQGEISAKFGWPSYTISNDNLTFEGGTLLPQFPDSCADMRTGFGITKLADGSFEVYRPAETCAEAPDFYNEVWGLTAAIIPTLKPA